MKTDLNSLARTLAERVIRSEPYPQYKSVAERIDAVEFATREAIDKTLEAVEAIVQEKVESHRAFAEGFVQSKYEALMDKAIMLKREHESTLTAIRSLKQSNSGRAEPPVEQSDTVENVNNNRMLAGWGRYNYMECADKGSHDMRMAFIAGYKRALYWASQPSLSNMDEREASR